MTDAAAELGDDDLRRLCEAHGIETAYDDIWGNRHEISPEAMRALLRDMGAFEPAQRSSALPPYVVVEEGASAFCVPLAPGTERQRLHWRDMGGFAPEIELMQFRHAYAEMQMFVS